MELTQNDPQTISLEGHHYLMTEVSASVLDPKGQKLLAAQHPDAYKEWQAYEARQQLSGQTPHLAVLEWSGSTRIPIGISINGRKVDSGRDGFLDDNHGVSFAEYTRIADTPDGQKMLIYWTNESLLEH